MADMVSLEEATAALTAAKLAEKQTRERAIEQAKVEIAAAHAQVERARADLADAIVEAARAGTRQKDIVAVTGYNRERVRQITRAGGVEPV